MLHIPVTQEEEQILQMQSVIVLGTQSGFFDLCEQLVVCIPMLGNVGIRMKLEQSLFTGEVHARKFDQPRQAIAHLVAASPLHKSEAKLIQRIHQDGMLIVHGLHAN